MHKALHTENILEPRQEVGGLFRLRQGAYDPRTTTVTRSRLLLDPLEVTKSYLGCDAVVHAVTGIVKVGVSRIQGYAVTYGLHHAALLVCRSGNALQGPEDKRMMRYHKVASQPYSFCDNLLGNIKTEQDARHLIVDETDLESCIVIIFLVSQRSQRFQSINYSSDRHWHKRNIRIRSGHNGRSGIRTCCRSSRTWRSRCR